MSEEELQALRRRCEELEAEVRRARESGSGFLRQVLDISPHFVFAKDREGRFTLVNRAVAEAYGTTVENLIGRSDADFDPDAGEVEQFRRDDLEVMESLREKVIAEEKITDATGRVRWLQTIKRPILNEDGRADQVLGVATDVTRYKELEQQLSDAALHDALTQLPNRALLADRMALALAASRRESGRSFAVLFVDLDRFKRINDSLGHGRGDELLIAIARRLEASIRPGDTVARLGGDEFVVLLGRVERTVEARHVAERIRRSLAVPIELGRHEVVISAAIGIAMAGSSYRDEGEILRDADTAMYRAKAKGLGNIVVFDPAMHREAVAQLEVENELRRAIDRGELRHHFQAIYRLPEVELAGYEMLLRWEHGERGLLLPGEFLEVAEESGLIVELDRWSLAEAARRASELGSRVPISVNLFSGMLLDPDLAPRIEDLCREHRILGEALRLEITEGAFLERKEVCATVLGHLRSIGVGVDLDDFGTGYSSLGYLRQLPLDRLKIDRSFVAALSGEGGKPGIARTVIDLAHSLGLRVVAEGVESPAHLAELSRLGCDFAQGYLLARPQPAGAFDWATGRPLPSPSPSMIPADSSGERF